MAMGRPPSAPATALGAAIRAKRAGRTGDSVAGDLGIRANTIYRIERGEHAPSLATSKKLAAWLGWTMEQVYDAAGRPPSA